MSPAIRSVLLGLSVLALAAGCNGIDAERHDRFRSRLGDTTITVYPAAVWEPAGSRADAGTAERLAGFLREHALAAPDTSNASIGLPREQGRYQQRVWKDSGAAFGRFVAAHPPAGEYALLAEVLLSATPDGRPFVGGIHAFVVDREGHLVDGVLLNSHHEPFRKAAPATVADATAVLLGVLQDDWLAARDEQAGRTGGNR